MQVGALADGRWWSCCLGRQLNGVKRRAGGREGGKLVNTFTGDSEEKKNKMKHLCQSTQEQGPDTVYHLSIVCHVKYVG